MCLFWAVTIHYSKVDNGLREIQTGHGAGCAKASLVNMKGKIYNAYDRTGYVYITNGVMWIILYISVDKRDWFPLKMGVL